MLRCTVHKQPSMSGSRVAKCSSSSSSKLNKCSTLRVHLCSAQNSEASHARVLHRRVTHVRRTLRSTATQTHSNNDATDAAQHSIKLVPAENASSRVVYPHIHHTHTHTKTALPSPHEGGDSVYGRSLRRKRLERMSDLHGYEHCRTRQAVLRRTPSDRRSHATCAF
jgi:hypothetical protein